MMRTIHWTGGAMLSLLICGAVFAGGGYGEQSTLQEAMSDEAEIALPAIAKLREEGPAALDRVIAERDHYRNHLRDTPNEPDAAGLTRIMEKLNQIIDQVGGQRYCSTSGLYWYTDLDKAKQAATEQNKPILALRMLGKLTEELSCANSRFFRTTLYANEEISQYLRDHYILHWETVREVPKLTIDYGDGRVVERTITGNSAHYILAADGRPIDALPGLYDPQSFLQWAEDGVQLHSELASLTGRDWERHLTRYHQSSHARLVSKWHDELNAVDPARWEPLTASAAVYSMHWGEQRALDLERKMTDQDWQALAARHAVGRNLDDRSRQLIRSENPTALQASRLAMTKSVVEDPVLRMIRQLEGNIARDTVQNEFRLRRQIHLWFADENQWDAVTGQVTNLNQQVYEKLFLMPLSDPWLGLVASDQYSGLVNAGTTPSLPVIRVRNYFPQGGTSK
ncbi:MAG: hypothetical protein WDZ51_19390 [Pirellulaceae bacterium]